MLYLMYTTRSFHIAVTMNKYDISTQLLFRFFTKAWKYYNWNIYVGKKIIFFIKYKNAFSIDLTKESFKILKII